VRPLLYVAIRLLEFLFAVGIVGCGVVVALTFVKDVKVLLPEKKEHAPRDVIIAEPTGPPLEEPS
jgi:hypothetical protein